MYVSNNITQIPSSPTSFHTVQEFQSPSSFLSQSEFEGFLDDCNSPRQSSSTSSDIASVPIPSALLTSPPIYNPDGSSKKFTSLQDALTYWQSWAQDHSYAVRKNRSKSRGIEKIIYKVYIQCECAGKKRGSTIPKQFRIRKDQVSKACECRFGGLITEKNSL